MSTDRISVLSTALPPVPVSPDDRQMHSLGFTTWTAPVLSWGQPQNLNSGVLYLAACWFEQGLTITKFAVAVTDGAKNITLVRWGVYHGPTLRLLASSGNIATTFALVSATGIFEFPLTEPWTAPESRNYACGLLQVGPAPAQCAGSLPWPVGEVIVGEQSGLTDLPDPFVKSPSSVQINYAAG